MQIKTSKKQTIALVISSLRMGGAERIASFLANGLVDDYDVVLFIWSDLAQFYEVDSRVRVRVIKTHMRGVFGNLERIFLLVKAFKQEGIKLAISFIHQTNILSIIAARFAQIPCIATEHSVFMALEGQRFWKYLRRITYPMANCVTTLTKRDLQHYTFVKNICVMPNPIAFLKETSKEEYCLKQPYILGVGRLIREKGFDEIIEAFRIFVKKYSKYVLVIAGDGVLKKELEKQSVGLNVKFLGQVTHLGGVYAGAEFLALASKREGLSNVLIESIMHKTPVISYDCPYGPSEIINNKNGILIDFNSSKKNRIASLANAFMQMVENKEQYTKNMEQEAINIKNRFDANIVLTQWKNFLPTFISP